MVETTTLRCGALHICLLLALLAASSIGVEGQPTGQPSSQPSRQPSTQPSRQPTRQPSSHPTGQPSSRPSMWPTPRYNISVIAGTGTCCNGGDDGPGTSAQMNGPYAVAIDKTSNYLYINVYWGWGVRRLSLSTGIITTFAGSGTPGYGGDGSDIYGVY